MSCFFQKNLLEDLSDIGKFDFIYSQEVLHHTKDPKQAFNNLVAQLDNNGLIAIYVYKKKHPFVNLQMIMLEKKLKILTMIKH
jgi:2-polyprenyl-3-methyl-5-hydroxy-6-metoxy-1,4-benzoquinol methylase